MSPADRLVNLTVPCLNEEAVLETTIRRTVEFIDSAAELAGWRIVLVIVDNGSADRTAEIARRLASQQPDRIRFRQLDRRGKGLAIRAGWASLPADVYAFMDADLATDLAALPELLETCRRTGGLAIGSRHLPESRVERSLLRRLFSWGYRLTLKVVLSTRINDLPCGFKAASTEVVSRILPQVRDNAWFFDTELAIRTERAGLPVTEIPVVWREANDQGRRSKVPLFRVASDYLRQSWRLRRELKATAPRHPNAPLS